MEMAGADINCAVLSGWMQNKNELSKYLLITNHKQADKPNLIEHATNAQ